MRYKWALVPVAAVGVAVGAWLGYSGSESSSPRPPVPPSSAAPFIPGPGHLKFKCPTYAQYMQLGADYTFEVAERCFPEHH